MHEYFDRHVVATMDELRGGFEWYKNRHSNQRRCYAIRNVSRVKYELALLQVAKAA